MDDSAAPAIILVSI